MHKQQRNNQGFWYSTLHALDKSQEIPPDDAMFDVESLPDEDMHDQPIFGLQGDSVACGVVDYVEWFSDGEDSRSWGM